MVGNGNLGTQMMLFNPLTDALAIYHPKVIFSPLGTAKEEVKEVTKLGRMYCQVQTFINFFIIFA